MKFELSPPKNRKVTDPEILADLVSVANQLGKQSLSMEEYHKTGLYDTSTVSRRFGTWNKALEKAGLDARNSFHTEQELLDNLYNVWIAKGKQPTRNDMNDHTISIVSSGAYIRKYGNWSKALIAFIAYINDTSSSIEVPKLDNQIDTKTRSSRDVNLRLRFRVLQRDNFRCKLCGASPATDSSVVLHVDHIIPFSKGGETTLDNLQTLCSKCNLGKSNL